VLLVSALEAYTKPAGVPDEIWAQVVPYLLPESHPVKPKLDKLFSKKRFTQDFGTLFEGGFQFKGREKKDQILVAKHPKLKGIVIKLYTDEQEGLPDWTMWIKRINGAALIRQEIDLLDVGSYFKVPGKWIYPLPDEPLGIYPNPKHFVLIVENMHVKSARANEEMWLSPYIMDEARMRALYLILQQVGLYDSVYIDNIPFCSDTRQAFIDTEHYLRWPVPLDRLYKRLPKETRHLWRDWLTNGFK
jgi:hypothetical protein